MMRGTSRDSLAAGQERLDAVVDEQPAAADLVGLSDGLFAVARLLDRESALRRALSDPSLPGEKKVRLLDTLLGSQLDRLGLDVLRGLARSRWSQPSDLVEAVETLAISAQLSAAEVEGHLDDVEDELFRFGRIVDREPRLRAALTDPGVPAERRTALLDDLIRGKVRPTTDRLLSQLVTAPRGRTLEDAVEELSRLAAARRRRLVASVTAAVDLTDDETERLRRALTRVYGREVQLQVDADPGIVGGLVVRVGDEVIDGSVAHRIDAARRRLSGG